MKKLKPSLIDKKRYILLDGKKEVIERVVLDKIEANKTRVWNPNDLNEQLI